ncbi:hypothetical protein [Phocaeicola sartorii]|uniref:hypothetical protein n=1 Tax=Phocaeicola sartorii TaxID=671267 RepID=UPI001F564176|nr:hypothetical protein [Phocaeicola sartorii]
MNNSDKDTCFVGKSLRTGCGGYGVNRDHIVITRPQAGEIADITEQAIAAGQVLNGRNIALYGMAALADDPENPGRHHLAPNATLINEGIIEIHLRDMVEAYKERIKKTPDDAEGVYRFIKCFAMAAGKDSMIVNEGVIRIYFDQDIDSDTPVYGETLLAGENSTIINNGEIQLLGNGSFATQARAIAVPANNMTIINNGKINLDMERASTIRILATTGIGGAIANYGSIAVKSSGRIMTIARFANTHILNEGTVDIVSKAKYIENKVSFLYQSYPLACAFYEHSLPNATPVPPIVNNGTVRVHLEGSEESTPQAVAFGIYSEMVGKEEQIHRMENSGTITVTKSGPYDFLVAELGVNAQSEKNFPFLVEIGMWNTVARDFAKTKDLFVCNSGVFDFSHAVLLLSGGDASEQNMKPEDLVYQRGEIAQRGDTCRVIHAEKLVVGRNE